MAGAQADNANNRLPDADFNTAEHVAVVFSCADKNGESGKSCHNPRRLAARHVHLCGKSDQTVA